MTTLRNLGRIYVPNPGSRAFPLRAAIGTRSASSWKSKTWRLGHGLSYGDQGPTPTCVRFGNAHNLMLEPIVRGDALSITSDLYRWAQENDAWPGSDYEGTSVDAGLQFLLHVAKVISEYRWARSMDDVLTRLSLSSKDGGGPLVVGTDFYPGMDVVGTPGERNRWVPTGEVLGGHCYVITGQLAPTAKRTRQIIVGNSHANNHEGIMDADAMEWLLFAQNGEASAVTEIPKTRKAA